MNENTEGREKFQRPEEIVNTRTKQRILNVIRIVTTVVLIVLVMFPVYWIIKNSFTPSSQLLHVPQPVLPTSFTLDHYRTLFDDTPFVTFLQNSLIVAAGTMIITGVLAVLGGYGLARAGFRGKRNLARGVLLTYMFPSILLAIPLYLIFLQLGLLNSRIALVLGHTGRALPFCLWLMWQYFQSIPKTYEESAWIYGASIPRALWNVMFPMSLPGIVAVVIFSFTVSWNDYTIALVLMNDTATYTVPLGLSLFLNETVVRWGRILAAGTITVLPPLVLIAFLQKYLLLGFGIEY